MPRPKKPISFATGEVSRLVGATRQQLAYWDKTGLVSPSLKSALGRGSRRRYSIQDIIELKILVRLQKSSVPLQRIRASFRFIRERSESLSSLIIMTNGKTIYTYQDDMLLVDTLKHGQSVLKISVQDLIAELRGKLDSPAAI